jgi:beta-galactosidase
VFLEFEGVRHGGEIFVNGTKVGLHENGVMAFGLDISNYVKPYPFQNVVALRIDNDWKYREKSTNSTYQWNDKNFNANYGGIPKNMYLHITDKLYQTLPLYSNLGTTGTYVYASQINIPNKSALIHAESQLKNEFSVPKTVNYQVEIFDLDNKKIAEFSGDKITIASGETKIISSC